MLGKLMKYELQATGRVFLPIYCALLIVSAVNGLFMALNFEIPTGIASAAYGALMVAICVMTLILTIQRFRQNLLGREGYLMLTLPVSADGLIVSKLLVSALWTIVSGIVVMLSILILSLGELNFSQLFDMFRQCLGSFLHAPPSNRLNLIFILLECVILAFTALFSAILFLYTCIAAGLLVNKRKELFSFGTFIVLSILTQTIISILAKLAESLHWETLVQHMTSYGQVHLGLGLVFLWCLLTGAVYYCLSRYLLLHRLNLE